jgi:hypothetical protein
MERAGYHTSGDMQLLSDTQPCQPSRFHYFVAAGWPTGIWLSTHSLVGGGFMLRSALPVARDLPSIFLLAGLVLCGLACGFLIGVLNSIFIFGPWMRARGRANGAPYLAGDRVRILAGKHKNFVGSIYEVWDERGQVRLDLGPEPRKDFSDVFTYTEVFRASVPRAAVSR